LDFFHKRADVFEFSINRGKPNVGDLVESSQMLHDHVAQHLCRNFPKVRSLHVVFNLADDDFDFLGAHRPFVASFFQAAADLLGVKWLPRMVLFNDLEKRFFDLLDRGNPAFAPLAETSAADRKSSLMEPGIDDGEVPRAAKRTFHRRFTPLAFLGVLCVLARNSISRQDAKNAKKAKKSAQAVAILAQGGKNLQIC
jgi:hypothetical protein